jgi:hypothetical protein
MKQIEIENNEIVKSFLNRTFFKSWEDKRYLTDSKYENYRTLELQISGHCDLKCTYCYYAKYSKDLYPAKISGKENVLKNLDIVLNWLEENNYWPVFEVFSGEIFSQELGFLAVEKLIDWLIKTKKENAQVIIPSNFSFIFDNKKIERVEQLLTKCLDNKICIYLSCSIDGKYCDDENRKFRDGKTFRDDEYYEKTFAFCKKWNFNFHPMIYSNKIEKWKDNWLWFQEMMSKYKMDFRSIYLLEVRNAEWTKKQLKDYYEFIRFLISWTFKTLIANNFVSKEKSIAQYVFENKLFNTFNIFSQCGRGLGCSIQSAIQLRLGDLTSSLCHRAAYKQHNMWKFKVENDKIVDVEALNANLLIAMESSHHSTYPMCEACLIKNVCNYQCLGSMYETNNDPMLPIPTVCALEHIKTAAIYDEMYDSGIYVEFLNWASKEKYETMRMYYKYFHKGAKE